MLPLPPSAQKFLQATQTHGFTPEIVVFEQATRTAQQAADAIGCDVGQIVKSLCFTVNGAPLMVLVSGANMLDTGKLARELGVGKKKVKRASAETVKSATGYSIGGVPPFGHATPLRGFIDQDLFAHNQIWAAAGHPNTVFPLTATQLQTATAFVSINLKQTT